MLPAEDIRGAWEEPTLRTGPYPEVNSRRTVFFASWGFPDRMIARMRQRDPKTAPAPDPSRSCVEFRECVSQARDVGIPADTVFVFQGPDSGRSPDPVPRSQSFCKQKKLSDRPWCVWYLSKCRQEDPLASVPVPGIPVGTSGTTLSAPFLAAECPPVSMYRINAVCDRHDDFCNVNRFVLRCQHNPGLPNA